MKWVLLFIMVLPGESGHDFSLQRMEFESSSLCEKAVTRMIDYNKEQESEANQLKNDSGKIQAIIGFKPIVCLQIAE